MKQTPLKRTPFERTRKGPSAGVLRERKRRRLEKIVYKANDAIWSQLVKLRAARSLGMASVSEKPASVDELLAHPSRNLNSHHFLRKELYPSLRWDVRDGICIYAWQHVLARGSAHDDPATFDAWAIPYMKKRHDFAYLKKRGQTPGKIGPVQIAEANVALRKLYLKQTGRDWGAQ
jgi:hypothetical protein